MTSMVVTGMPPSGVVNGSMAAGPTMTSMYATPSYMTPSYTPAPVAAMPMQGQSVVVQAPGMAMYGQRPATTEAMKSPEALELEKGAYHKALEAQLQKETTAAEREGELQKAVIQQQAKAQIAQFTLQVEEQMRFASMQIDQQTAGKTNALMEAAVTQRTLMDERIAVATMGYTKQKAMQEFAVKNSAVQKQFFDAEKKLMAEFQKTASAGAKMGVPTSVVV